MSVPLQGVMGVLDVRGAAVLVALEDEQERDARARLEGSSLRDVREVPVVPARRLEGMS